MDDLFQGLISTGRGQFTMRRPGDEAATDATLPFTTVFDGVDGDPEGNLPFAPFLQVVSPGVATAIGNEAPQGQTWTTPERSKETGAPETPLGANAHVQAALQSGAPSELPRPTHVVDTSAPTQPKQNTWISPPIANAAGMPAEAALDAPIHQQDEFFKLTPTPITPAMPSTKGVPELAEAASTQVTRNAALPTPTIAARQSQAEPTRNVTVDAARAPGPGAHIVATHHPETLPVSRSELAGAKGAVAVRTSDPIHGTDHVTLSDRLRPLPVAAGPAVSDAGETQMADGSPETSRPNRAPSAAAIATAGAGMQVTLSPTPRPPVQEVERPASQRMTETIPSVGQMRANTPALFGTAEEMPSTSVLSLSLPEGPTASAQPQQNASKVTRETPWTLGPRPVPATTAYQTAPGPMQVTLMPSPASLADSQVGADQFLPQHVAVGASPAAPLTTVATPFHALPNAPNLIAQQIASALQDRSGDPGQPLELALDPPELGRVRMHMADHAGVMTLTIHAERPETAELMRRHMDLLAQEFSEAGIDAPSVRISQDGADSNSGSNGTPDARATELEGSDEAAPIQPQSRSHDGALDLRL